MKTKLNISKAGLVALCALVLSTASLFAGKTPKTAEERGIIKSVDNNACQIVVTDQKTQTEGTFRWNDRTKFIEHDRAVNASALKAGLPVHLTYATGSGPAQLVRVKIAPNKAQMHATTSPSSPQKP